MNRIQLIKSKCWSCWWREGGHCFSEDFGSVPKKGITILGHDITQKHIRKCKQSYVSKRSMLPIPKDKLTITSEYTKETIHER